jgi:hypothetical protein
MTKTVFAYPAYENPIQNNTTKERYFVYNWKKS